MPLLEPRFISLAQLLNQEMQPSFRVVTTIGRELVDAFAALHSTGLCYRDISFGNLRVDPAACEVVIIDVDNVGVDGGQRAGQGHRPVHGPGDPARRGAAVDRHRPAFAGRAAVLPADARPPAARPPHRRLLQLGSRHPKVGNRAARPELRDQPLFVFDPDDPSNRPVPGDGVVTWWSIYPQQCRRVFTQAFTAGLHDASLNGRVTEGTWRRALLGLHDCVCGLSGLRCGGVLRSRAAQAAPAGTAPLPFRPRSA